MYNLNNRLTTQYKRLRLTRFPGSWLRPLRAGFLLNSLICPVSSRCVPLVCGLLTLEVRVRLLVVAPSSSGSSGRFRKPDPSPTVEDPAVELRRSSRWRPPGCKPAVSVRFDPVRRSGAAEPA